MEGGSACSRRRVPQHTVTRQHHSHWHSVASYSTRHCHVIVEYDTMLFNSKLPSTVNSVCIVLEVATPSELGYFYAPARDHEAGADGLAVALRTRARAVRVIL